MAISTNPKPTIYRNLYENTGPDSHPDPIHTRFAKKDYHDYVASVTLCCADSLVCSAFITLFNVISTIETCGPVEFSEMFMILSFSGFPSCGFHLATYHHHTKQNNTNMLEVQIETCS